MPKIGKGCVMGLVGKVVPDWQDGDSAYSTMNPLTPSPLTGLPGCCAQ